MGDLLVLSFKLGSLFCCFGKGLDMMGLNLYSYFRTGQDASRMIFV